MWAFISWRKEHDDGIIIIIIVLLFFAKKRSRMSSKERKTSLHPILKELGLLSAENSTSKNYPVSSLDVLNYLIHAQVLTPESIQSAVQALQESKHQHRQETEEVSSTKDYRTRHIALRFLYDGANFSGLAQNLGQESDNSVERSLFQALLRARLVESRETSGYSRCGRTDRGVSAAGQVVALHIKSAIPLDASLDQEGNNLIDEDALQLLPKNEYEKLSAWVIPRKRNKKDSATDSARVCKDLVEYPYAKILNNLLPPEIRILGWAPVSNEFSARFSATTRTYRYFFVRRQLDLQQMQTGLQLLIGKHDFRNFCKMDVEKVYNFERIIHDAKLIVEEDKSNTMTLSEQMCHVEIHGQAFLWHQIRCIMEVLFLIGNKLEEPTIINELFNVEKYPGKPAYSLAPEKPLVLNDCGYPNLQIGYSVQNVWTVSCQLEQKWEELMLAAARIRNGINAFQSVVVLKDDLLQFATCKITEKRRKLQKLGTLTQHDDGKEIDLSTTLPTDGTTIEWKVALKWFQEKSKMVPDSNGLNTSIHIPILKRSRGTTYEQKVNAIQKSDKRRHKYEENVIKKRKTAEEDAAFYNHKTQQGGTGL